MSHLLDRFQSADVGAAPELTPAQDFAAMREQQGRDTLLAAVKAAIERAREVTANAHRRHGLNLIDVADYLTYAAEALESEAEI